MVVEKMFLKGTLATGSTKIIKLPRFMKIYGIISNAVATSQGIWLTDGEGSDTKEIADTAMSPRYFEKHVNNNSEHMVNPFWTQFEDPYLGLTNSSGSDFTWRVAIFFEKNR